MPISIETVSELCRDFLEPLLPLLDDPEITDIHRNGNGTVFVKRQGLRQQVDCAISEDKLEIACIQIAHLVCNAEISGRTHPILDGRLADGSRINVVMAPISQPGIQLSIRKFNMKRFTLDELERIGSVAPEAAAQLRYAVKCRESILISGATDSGKTTLLNALLDLIPEDERLCVVEDTVELQLRSQNVVRLEERKEQPGVTPVTLRQLVRATLRQAPDRIILGEVRGGEAYELITALSTGHGGSVCTIHANSATDALERLVSCCAESGIPLAENAFKRRIAGCLHYVVHMNQQRCLVELVEVEGVDAGEFEVTHLYRREL